MSEQAYLRELDPEQAPKTTNGEKNEYSLNRITFTPSSAKPGETLYVDLPKLQRGMMYVPGSVFLMFDIEVAKGHANNVLVWNVGRLLVKRLKISLGGEILQDIDEFGLFKNYEDSFKNYP